MECQKRGNRIAEIATDVVQQRCTHYSTYSDDGAAAVLGQEVRSAVGILGIEQQRLRLHRPCCKVCAALAQQVMLPGAFLYDIRRVLRGQICIRQPL